MDSSRPANEGPTYPGDGLPWQDLLSTLEWLNAALVLIDENGHCLSAAGPNWLPAALQGTPLASVLEAPPGSESLASLLARPRDVQFTARFVPGNALFECQMGNPDQNGRRHLWVRPVPEARGDEAEQLRDVVLHARRTCHNLNNTFLALRCVCEGVSMATGTTVVRADDLLGQAAEEVARLSAACRATTASPVSPASSS